MLQAATAFFKTSQISQNYAFSSTSTGLTSSSSAAGPASPFHVGLWKVQEAVHKTNAKKVSIWSFDKRGTEMDRLGQTGARERVIEVLKAEASALGRLRHPCVLEMVEPVEETRSELTFATEPLLSSLTLSIPTGGPLSTSVELDEIEIQKGILQLTKGLGFLHTSARLVHSNLAPDSVVINGKGDWKICGLGLTIPLLGPDGAPTRWEFPSYDNRLPSHIQRSFDYIAPEYALDEQIDIASDFYSLGCIVFAVHNKGVPPFRNRGNLSTMRSNVGRLEGGGGLQGMETWDPDLRSLITMLITPKSLTRLSSSTLPTHSYFSSLAISTLNFLDRSNFASKTREEKIAFMKGLNAVLSRFSEGMKRRKILPSLLEEMKDPLLLSSILPNVFNIASNLDSNQFQALVLPSLKPLFTIKDPPLNMIVLLDNLQTLQSKTAKAVFRTDVLPLVYNALESEQPQVQEKALSAIPDLCDSVDYAEVQGVLFPRVAIVFTKTRILSVKVATLNCFLSMVKTLDQTSLTQKLVPLLSKIRTKEPAVMMACLSVQEAMGLKVEREAVATLVLPQLWAMSVGPLLNVEQFGRFMNVIKVLGERVEREHNQHLRDAQRIEDRSALQASTTGTTTSKSLDFESLVGGSGTTTPVPHVNGNGASSASTWEDDVWGSLLSSESPQPGSTPLSQPMPLSPRHMASAKPPSSSPTTSTLPSVRALGAKPIASTSYNPSAFRAPAPLNPPPSQSRPQPSSVSQSLFNPPRPASTPTVGFSGGILQPISSSTPLQSYNAPISPTSKPNYNISLGPAASGGFSSFSSSPSSSFGSQPLMPSQPFRPPIANQGTTFSAPILQPGTRAPTIGMSSVLTPNKPSMPAWGSGGTTGKKGAGDWGDFDPLG